MTFTVKQASIVGCLFCVLLAGCGSETDQDVQGIVLKSPDGPGGRLNLVEYDYDNNGVFEGQETYSYASNGQLEQIQYTYAVDDTIDEPTYLYNQRTNSTTQMTYDANQRLDQVSINYQGVPDSLAQLLDRVDLPEVLVNSLNISSRSVTDYTWRNDGLIDALTTQIFNGAGILIATMTTTTDYTGQRLNGTTTETVVAVAEPIVDTVVYAYDATGVVTELTWTDSGRLKIFEYEYINGRVLGINQLFAATGLIDKTFQVNYTSETGSEIESITISDVTENITETIDYIKERNGIRRLTIDRNADDIIEHQQRRTYEYGDCQAVIEWTPVIFGQTTVVNSQYSIANGYYSRQNCGGE